MRVVSYLRDRVALLFNRKRNYLFVVVAILICAVVMCTFCITKLESSRSGIDFNSSHHFAKLCDVQVGLWEYIKIANPSPEKGRLFGVDRFRKALHSDRRQFLPNEINIGFFNKTYVPNSLWRIESGLDRVRVGKLLFSRFAGNKIENERLGGDVGLGSPSIFTWHSEIPEAMSARFIAQNVSSVGYISARHKGALYRSEGFTTDSIGFNHLAELSGIDISNADSNDENQYLADKLENFKISPKPCWRLILIGVGVGMFGWGRWITSYTKRRISERTAILGIICMIAGVILALWSV